MLRLLSAVSRGVRVLEYTFARPSMKAIPLLAKANSFHPILPFSHWITHNSSLLPCPISYRQPCQSLLPLLQPSFRTLTKFSLKKGKRKSVKAVIRRFYRLNWGIWIRTKAGRQKHLWRKTPQRRRRLRQHVFCNATQSTLLDKMVTRFWKRPHYYVDDPYEPYHKREEFPYTRRKPI